MKVKDDRGLYSINIYYINFYDGGYFDDPKCKKEVINYLRQYYYVNIQNSLPDERYREEYLVNFFQNHPKPNKIDKKVVYTIEELSNKIGIEYLKEGKINIVKIIELIEQEEPNRYHFDKVQRFALDLLSDITISVDEEDYFNFFFYFRLKSLDIMKIDGFLNYNLKHSFNSDAKKYFRFLNLICLGFKIDKNKKEAIKQWIIDKGNEPKNIENIIKKNDKLLNSQLTTNESSKNMTNESIFNNISDKQKVIQCLIENEVLNEKGELIIPQYHILPITEALTIKGIISKSLTKTVRNQLFAAIINVNMKDRTSRTENNFHEELLTKYKEVFDIEFR